MAPKKVTAVAAPREGSGVGKIGSRSNSERAWDAECRARDQGDERARRRGSLAAPSPNGGELNA